MDAGDLPLAVRLKDQAGWNQTEADLLRFLALAPDGCFVAECDGVPVGTAVACVFGRVGWIAMLVVDPAYRGRGIGRRLVEHAIEHLERQAARSIRLDATPLGQPVYEKLGFRAEYELARWEGVAPARRLPHGVVLAAADQLEAIAEFDRRLTATPRKPLLDHLFRQQPGAMWVAIGPKGLAGYAAWREGSLAAFIGPAMALSAKAGQELVDAMLAACAGCRVFVDVPCDNEPATRWAQACGFTVQRPFTRMVRGEPVADRPACLWASSGPENG
jgi:ribosomal protein S18 acetylase RimI-like enzyme